MSGEGRGKRRVRIFMVISLMLTWSCSAHQPELSDEFKDRLSELQAEAGQAVEEAVAKQVQPGWEQKSGASARTLLKAGEPIWIQSGKSRVLQVPYKIKRVSIADPEVAGIVVLGPNTIMVNAKPLPKRAAGEVETGTEVSGIFLGRTITPPPSLSETTLIIWGGDHGDDVNVHTLTVADFMDYQVMLEVTVAEVNRTALEQHGFDFRILRDDVIAASFLGAGAPVQQLTTIPPRPGEPLLPLTLGQDSPAYAFIFPKEGVVAFLQALDTEGLGSILAQPKLTAMSGQTAVFQVGGEIPIRISSSFVADVEFKPFGTIVNFLPRVADDGQILLTVSPEVSEADFSRTVEGIPTFLVRRASTSMRMRNGETLVIGGLLQHRRTENIRGVPYLKDIPFLGYLFRTSVYDENTIEVIVAVKPTLVRPIATGEQIPLPTERGPFTSSDVRTQPEPAKKTRPRVPGLP